MAVLVRLVSLGLRSGKRIMAKWCCQPGCKQIYYTKTTQYTKQQGSTDQPLLVVSLPDQLSGKHLDWVTHNCCQARTWVPGGSISRLILKSFIFKFSTNTINWTIFNGIKQSNIRSPSPIFQPTPSTEQSSGPSSISSSVPSTSKSLGSTKSTSASPEIALASTAFQTN